MNIVLIFLTAFCSFAYEVIIAAKLSQVGGLGVIIFPLTIAFALFGRGLGSLIFQKLSLITIESSLTLLGFITLPIIILVSIDASTWLTLSFGFLSMFAIGTLSGMEFQYLLKTNIYRTLLIDSIASFIGAVFFILVLSPVFGLINSMLIIVFVNLLIVILLSKKYYLIILALILLFPIEEKLLNLKYAPNGEKTVKLKTKYMEIIQIKQGDYLSVFLNGAVQFRKKINKPIHYYNFYLIDPYLSIFDYKDILLIGGGSGLPAQVALTHDINLDMVDLDPDWVKFAQTNDLMKRNSGNALNNPRVNLIYSDGFQFALNNNKKYDFIIIDFPEAEHLVAVRVMSIQFANDLKRSLNEDGAFVIQHDGYINEELKKMAMQTYRDAGMFPVYSERKTPSEHLSQFGVFKSKKGLNKFKSQFNNYKKLPKVKRLKSLEIKNIEKGNTHISFYDPKFLVIELFKQIWGTE